MRQGLGLSVCSWPGLGAPWGALPSPNLRLGDVRAGGGGVLPHLPCRWSRDSSFRVDFQELGPSRTVSPTWGGDRRAAGPAFLTRGPRAVPASRLRGKGLGVRESGPCRPGHLLSREDPGPSRPSHLGRRCTGSDQTHVGPVSLLRSRVSLGGAPNYPSPRSFCIRRPLYVQSARRGAGTGHQGVSTGLEGPLVLPRSRMSPKAAAYHPAAGCCDFLGVHCVHGPQSPL